MDIITRNFLAVMCNHAFAQQRPLEPMTDWKWTQVALLALSMRLDAVQMMPEDKRHLALQAENILPKEENSNTENGEENGQEQDSTPNPAFCNKRLNRRLQTIREEEEHDNDRAPYTWTFFSLLVCNAEQLIGGRISMPLLLQQTAGLRQQGHLIDYPKLETWIQRMKIRKAVDWQTTIMTDIFQIPSDEIQYTWRHQQQAPDMLIQALEHQRQHIQEACMQQRTTGRTILMPLSTATARHIQGRRLLPRRITLRYTPREALPLLWRHFRSRMDLIEE